MPTGRRHPGILPGVTPSAPDAVPVSEAAPVPAPPAVAALAKVCPYLLADREGWRSAHPTRAHRCTAVAPPVALALAKQRSLCLGAGHTRCATYLAAAAVDGDPAAGVGREDSLWPGARTTPVILETVRAAGLAHARVPRLGGQLLLGALMVVALVALVGARLVAPPIEGPGTTPLASQPGVVPGMTPSSTRSPASTSAATPMSTPAPTPSPDPTPVPTPSGTPRPSIATTTYRVASGDTLSTIAARFNTTVGILVELNGITNPSLIRIGQVLQVPAQ